MYIGRWNYRTKTKSVLLIVVFAGIIDTESTNYECLEEYDNDPRNYEDVDETPYANTST